MSDKTSLGDRMKDYEACAESKLLPGLPVIARIDGRAFHSFTAGLNRPYDAHLSGLMARVTTNLVRETDALIGYTQSDEISLLFYPKDEKSQIFFNGRRDKLVSSLASMATYYFNDDSTKMQWAKTGTPAFFDCRVFSVPTKMEAYNYFLWRERDATKNSISMAAQAYFSHKQLMGKHSSAKQEMLFSEKGINWNDYPAFFKRGTYVQRLEEFREFTNDELKTLPANHEANFNRDLKYRRRSVKIVETPPLSQVVNKLEFIFAEQLPKVSHENQNFKE